ncbi:MAG: hypothetical protein Ta2F_17590 [Termitinemataceae bacterium]|nr:MAG: hypothetical protein Ta2F_17590 [Termitinemataceae bacterium]
MRETRTEKELDKILKHLNKLGKSNKSSAFDKLLSMIDAFSLAELEQLALRYSQLTPTFKRPYMCDIDPPVLHNLLSRRAYLLNAQAFYATPEIIERYLIVNEHFKSALHNAALEAQSLATELDERVKNKGASMPDYSIEIELWPFIAMNDPENEGETIESDKPIDQLLQRILPNMSYDWKAILKKDHVYGDNWFDLCGIDSDKLKGQEICYPMHELWEHTVWSIHDIILINLINTSIEIIYWHQNWQNGGAF